MHILQNKTKATIHLLIGDRGSCPEFGLCNLCVILQSAFLT